MLNRKVFIASALAAFTTFSAFNLVAFAQAPAGTTTMAAERATVQGDVARLDQDMAALGAAENRGGSAAAFASDNSAVKVDMEALESAIAPLIAAISARSGKH